MLQKQGKESDEEYPDDYEDDEDVPYERDLDGNLDRNLDRNHGRQNLDEEERNGMGLGYVGNMAQHNEQEDCLYIDD